MPVVSNKDIYQQLDLSEDDIRWAQRANRFWRPCVNCGNKVAVKDTRQDARCNKPSCQQVLYGKRAPQSGKGWEGLEARTLAQGPFPSPLNNWGEDFNKLKKLKEAEGKTNET